MQKPENLRIKKIISVIAGLLAVMLAAQVIFSSCAVQTLDASVGEKKGAAAGSAPTQTVAAEAVATTEPVTTQAPTTEPQQEIATEEPYSEPEPTTQPETEAEVVEWATVMTMETKCPFEEQWAQGYNVAIDYPDKTYKTYHIELTEEDRDVLEHLCMGEFGTGGFIGAALIAQCVKDAMCFDGYKTVEDVRVSCRYDASLDNTPSQEVKNAVSYVFDSDHAAVQHRIMYMYNPNLVSSAFHESQNYILTYGDVRFFDRWGY